MTIKFNQEEENMWFSEDKYWGVVQGYYSKLALYKQDTVQFYVYTGFKCETWEEIQEYIKNHEN